MKEIHSAANHYRQHLFCNHSFYKNKHLFFSLKRNEKEEEKEEKEKENVRRYKEKQKEERGEYHGDDTELKGVAGGVTKGPMLHWRRGFVCFQKWQEVLWRTN